MGLRLARGLVVWTALLGGSGCGATKDAGLDGGADGVSHVADANSSVAVDASVPVVTVRLSDVERRLFATSCSTFSVCHGDGSPQKGMSLVAPTYATLVSQPSTEVPTRLRVVPGDPARSYLFEKISTDTPASGKRMPPDQPLDPAAIALVKAWIEQGARDD